VNARTAPQPILTGPGPVFCAIDHLHRSPEVADAAVAGWFRHAGIELHLTCSPNWLGLGYDLDEEWGIEFAKLYEGLDLAAAFSATGDRRYQDAWEDLAASFCRQVPVGHHTSDVSARRIQNWIYAWQRFASAPAFAGLRPGLASMLVERIEADVAHLACNLTPERNHRTLELYTLLLVAVAFDQRAEAVVALQLLAENAAADFCIDGVHRERSSDYHCIVLRSLVGAVVLARGAELPVPAVLRDRVDRAATVALHLQRPDGSMPALSDGDQGDFRALLGLAASALDRQDLLWAASLGRAGRPPAARGRSFPVGGYAVQRSGWGDGSRAYEQEAWAVLDCGPLGDGGHGHYDQLSVELHASGRTLAVDPGRFTYAEEAAGWRHWFKGTAAHNTVTVDGLDQVEYRRGKPRGPLPQARLVERTTTPGQDRLVAVATSPRHDARHKRTLTLIASPQPWWLVEDELVAPGPHRYELRWHLSPEAWDNLTRNETSAGVQFLVPGATVTLVDPPGPVGIETGWVSPAYGVRVPAPVVVVRTPPVASARFVTKVVPC
jgi:Heparinase II/III-like protein/Heparinase II/III N-terminus